MNHIYAKESEGHLKTLADEQQTSSPHTDSFVANNLTKPNRKNQRSFYGDDYCDDKETDKLEDY